MIKLRTTEQQLKSAENIMEEKLLRFNEHYHDSAVAHALLMAIEDRKIKAQDNCDGSAMTALNGVINYAAEILRNDFGIET